MLEKAGQDVAKNKTLQRGSQSGSDDLESTKIRGGGHWFGSKKGEEDRGYPGENEKDEGFESQASACQLSGGLSIVVFAHNLRMDGVKGDCLHVRLDRYQDAD